MKELFEALLAALRRGETAALWVAPAGYKPQLLHHPRRERLGPARCGSEDGGVRRREHDWDGRRRRR